MKFLSPIQHFLLFEELIQERIGFPVYYGSTFLAQETAERRIVYAPSSLFTDALEQEQFRSALPGFPEDTSDLHLWCKMAAVLHIFDQSKTMWAREDENGDREYGTLDAVYTALKDSQFGPSNLYVEGVEIPGSDWSYGNDPEFLEEKILMEVRIHFVLPLPIFYLRDPSVVGTIQSADVNEGGING